ncbi:[Fe-S]-binding protein [Streptomyces agglomeratus]|uniref:[Fe-S]-binding protein n=1 Tax=Streptomyces agglomeratus TaxID=285458 RepID=A0A1E5PFN9_9ACTN|nr:FAD-dependent oxidoreductase [Streptomyces agglomeratus]OEJ28341.1 [Fe-S]-binding protein [Streptomyces agglomeratus]
MTDVPVRSGSYWMEYGDGPVYPRPPDGLEVDVAVIGAGIAGISTAWELARAGKSVALLEADRVASGVTGHTTAKVSALHGTVYQRLRSTRGPQGAALYARSQQDAIGHLVAVCEELGIDCDLERAPAFTYAETAKEARTVKAEAEAALAAGLPASYVTETGLPFPVAGAVRVEGQALFHPRKYLYALVADLERRGGQIFEGTRIVGLREGEPCRLTTEDGRTVSARDVVVATHYPVFDRSLLFARLKPHRELVVAGVIPAAQDPGGMYLTPEGSTRSVRTAPYGEGERLLIVTGEKFTPGTGRVEERYERLQQWTTRRFPEVRLTHRWAAQDNEPTDGVPFVGALHPRARHSYVATGFNGWGMAGGVMSGKLLAARITGEKPPWTDLYDPVRLRPVKEAPSMMRFQAAAAGHFVGDRLPFVTGGGPASRIAPGGGAVVRKGARHVAVHRDDAGELHAVSARCTHLGCLVRFNDAERTWECPCHGSRFGIGGEVLQGPALHPLERVHDLKETEEGDDA